MNFILESNNKDDYLKKNPPIVQFSSPLLQGKISIIKKQSEDKKEQARLAFEIARDEITHTFDSKNELITIESEEVLKQKEGICFAKAHLLCSLLRGLGIPSGFCYQRVLKNSQEPSLGHALHGLNALYLEGYGWFRVDPRGNKLGINSQFSIEQEQLAYPIRKELGEVDYPNIFINPLEDVIQAMRNSKNSQELFFTRPEFIK